MLGLAATQSQAFVSVRSSVGRSLWRGEGGSSVGREVGRKSSVVRGGGMGKSVGGGREGREGRLATGPGGREVLLRTGLSNHFSSPSFHVPTASPASFQH